MTTKPANGCMRRRSIEELGTNFKYLNVFHLKLRKGNMSLWGGKIVVQVGEKRIKNFFKERRREKKGQKRKR